MNKEILKKIATGIGIILFFIILSYAFVPQVLGGKIVNQSDISAWHGMTHEITSHNQEHPDDKTLWTNSMFGGMPTVTMYDDFEGDCTKPLYKFLMSGARPANYIFVTLLGAFLLMLSLGMNTVTAIGGAIAVAFCAYNMQIIQVGHNTKMQAIAFMPWVLAAMIFTYRSILEHSGKLKESLLRAILGASLFGLAISFQIKANHPQITYYLAIVILIYVIALFADICRKKELREKAEQFMTASMLLLVIGCIGIATNLNKLIPTYEYAEYTMRGGSELAPKTEHDNDKGLDLDYATAWSYGINETPNLLIPNFNGGSSAGALKGENSETYKVLKQSGQPDLKDTMKSLPLYWGPQPYTAGPMYVGAISLFLFILGLLLFKGKEKWWLLAATVLAVMMAWGNHFMWFTRLLFDYAPMYNKFRTVSMALTVLQVTVPVLGFLVLDRILKKEYDNRMLFRKSWIAYGITAGFCLVFVLIPSLAGPFTSAADKSLPDFLTSALQDDRKMLLVKDALRSICFITMAFVLIRWAFSAKNDVILKKRTAMAGTAVCILVFLDMAPVGKRYLNSDHFVKKRDFTAQFAERPVDKLIKEDTALDYRVLDLSVNTFNSAVPSYHHKCIGGYSPAKLQRYQDLIERYLSREINSLIKTVNGAKTIQDVQDNMPEMPVISMLNGKYVILGGNLPPVMNENAFGNCWFVHSAAPAANPDEEISLIGSVNLRDCAVIGDDFSWAREKIDSLGTLARTDHAPADSVWMTHYAPNELKYRCRTTGGQAVIFSEIYFPKGWKAWIAPAEDTGNRSELELFRADWMLRGAIIPGGEYEITMRFDPDSYRTGKDLSRASSITLLILLVLSGLLNLTYLKKSEFRNGD